MVAKKILITWPSLHYHQEQNFASHQNPFSLTCMQIIQTPKKQEHENQRLCGGAKKLAKIYVKLMAILVGFLELNIYK